MANWHDIVKQKGNLITWPYPVRYDDHEEAEADVLVLGGGIAGCWAAITAARNGASVILVEKAASIRSGAGGPGCDHWENPMTNPLSNMSPEERAAMIVQQGGGYGCGIGREIQCREGWDTLLEMEQMGGKIRDTEDKYVGLKGRDDKTKIMLSPRYQPINATIRIWGTTFKPALRRQAVKLGVKIYDRTMATSLLTEGGVQGARVAGATGFNDRTGAFTVFKAKATILAMAGVGSVWVFNTELGGISTFRPRSHSGDGFALAWRAGAEFTQMEKSGLLRLGTGYKHVWYGGAGDASYENVALVDADGKKLPLPTQGWPDGGNMPMASMRSNPQAFREKIMSGEYALPFYGDFPGMPEDEREVTWHMMLRQEAATNVIVDTYEEAGFDASRDQLQNYQFIEGTSPANWRSSDSGRDRGGLLIDWDLKTSLEGLYAVGEQLYNPGDHSFAAATGRYAGRKAAAYVKEVGAGKVSGDQVAQEKARVYAPVSRTSGIEWKEFHAAIARTMQSFCSEFKTEHLFNMGLDALADLEQNWLPKLYALDPHKLMRTLEDTSILTYAQMVLHGSLARRASSNHLDFHRIDYPQVDPPEWAKHVTVKQVNGKVVAGERPLDYYGDLGAEWQKHNPDYAGVYKA
jgi:succinate dehydrogenase/fumarate reductase flavoprotein subunit